MLSLHTLTHMKKNLILNKKHVENKNTNKWTILYQPCDASFMIQPNN